MELDQDILQEFSTDFFDNLHNLPVESNATDINLPQKVHLEYLEKYFGHTSFRSLQWDIINAIMNLKKDVCAIMATGYGKSLCYQYPAVFTGGVTLVISPLISLMEDQVQTLTISNIPACLLGSVGRSSDLVLEGDYRIIYMTPEFVNGDKGKEFLEKIKSKNVIVIAIDEAHCISSWGHDFRFAYSQLNILRDIFPEVPLLAVTATATIRVRNDIVSSLKMRDPLVLCSSFDRPNLYFEVNHRSGNSLITNLRRVYGESWRLLFNESAIVYTVTRSRADEITEELKNNGICCLAYHAGKTINERTECHQRFIHDKIKVIVATIAFGMGINKPDVRNIIHFGSSRDLDSYYQEVGRAGRDGAPAKCITFYSASDFIIHEYLRKNASGNLMHRKERMSNLMKEYLQLTSCRRAFLLSYFEEKSPETVEVHANCCDICKSKLLNISNCARFGLNSEGKYNILDDYQKFLTVVKASKVKYGLKKYIVQLNKQKLNFRTHPTYNLKAEDAVRWWQEIAKLLLRDGYITELKIQPVGAKYSYNIYGISNKGITFLENSQKGLVNGIWETPTIDMHRLLKYSRPAQTEQDHNVSSIETKSNVKNVVKMEDDETRELYRELLKERLQLAEICDCMPYMVASNEALMKMSIFKPKEIDELNSLKLDGFTEGKIQKFGTKFLEVINKYIPTQKQSLRDILLKNPIKNDTLKISGSELASLFKDGLDVNTIAELKSTTTQVVWESVATSLREGFEFKLSTFGITSQMKEDVARIILKEQNEFLDNVPNLTAAQKLKERHNLQISEEIFFLIWTYLQIRVHLHNLNVEFNDFDPIPNLSDFLVKNNLNMILNEIKIENETAVFPDELEKNEKATTTICKEENDRCYEIKIENETAMFPDELEKNKKVTTAICKQETTVCKQENDHCSIFDDEFNVAIERMEIPPLTKKQKIELPTKTNNDNFTEILKNSQEVIDVRVPTRTSLLLQKKKTKNLPPWLRKDK